MLLFGIKVYPIVPFRAKLGITIGSGQMDGSWLLAIKPVCTINDTEPSDWLNIKINDLHPLPKHEVCCIF